MKRPVVNGAKRHGPFVTHLAGHGSGLGKAYMMGMTRGATANEAGLGGHKTQVFLVPNPTRGADGQSGFVDLTRGTGPVLSIGFAVPNDL